MKYPFAFFIVLLTNLGLKAQDKKQFTFLLGNWKNQGKTISEHWVAKGNNYLGKSYKHQGADSTLTESVEIKKLNGIWNYCVTGFEKGNQGKTNFALVYAVDNIFVFENKTHDFPQRVVYQNTGKKGLKAWIEGTMNGKESQISFSYFPY